ncbi:DoxX family protein [Streptomyces sp. NPDC003691]
MENIRAAALLVARVVLGIVFIAHGKLKLEHADQGPESFERFDIPLPEVAFWFTALVEVVGGGAFIVGLALPVVGALFATVTLGALFYVHEANGFWAERGGYEYVLVLAAVSVALGFTARRWSLDELLVARYLRRPADRTGGGSGPGTGA